MSEAFTARLREQFTADDGERASAAIDAYFTGEGERFTGSQFEDVVDNDHPNEITARDLVAVTMLSVQVPPRPARWLLGDVGRDAVHRLLSEVPDDIDIWDPRADALLQPSGPLDQLWGLLGRAYWPTPRSGNGLGGTTKRSKLLASKRPRLVPVVDDVVRRVLGPVDDYWQAFRFALSDGDLRGRIEQHTSRAPESVSLLRRVDVVIWMHGKGYV